MKYEEFKSTFVERFQEYLPAQYQSWHVQVLETVKVNGCHDTVVVMPPNGTGGSPNLYVKEFFDYYTHCKDMEKVCRKAAAIFVMGMDYISRLATASVASLPKNRIIFTLIHHQRNERLLGDIPHRQVMDLAVIYRILLDAEDGGFDSTIITNDIAAEWGVEEEQLYEYAMENTPRILSAEIMDHENIFAILTNDKRIFGATAMLYPDMLKSIADSMEADLFILPASVHEVFLVPDIGQDVMEMNRTIVEANTYMTEQEEFLSDHAYYYHRETDQVCIPKWK